MTDIIVAVTVKCEKCGAELDASFYQADRYNAWTASVEVEPCQVCIDRAYDRGLDEGYAKGQADAA